MYKNGRGVGQDDKTAFRWFRLSAEQGDANAQYDLGSMYALGRGIIKDYFYAHMWGNLAAAIGNAIGCMLRDLVAKEMNSATLSTARKLARECVLKKYKAC